MLDSAVSHLLTKPIQHADSHMATKHARMHRSSSDGTTPNVLALVKVFPKNDIRAVTLEKNLSKGVLCVSQSSPNWLASSPLA